MFDEFNVDKTYFNKITLLRETPPKLVTLNISFQWCALDAPPHADDSE